MRRLRNHLRRFPDCVSGNYAVITALILPMIAGIAGGAVDFYVYNDQQKQLQSVADSAALAATREASLGGWTQHKAEAVVDSFIAANFKNYGASSAVYTREVTVDQQNRLVKVAIEQDHYGYFVAGYFRHSPQIRVTSMARAAGQSPICVIGLHTKDRETVSLDSDAVLSAPGCAVYSNSADTRGMTSERNAILAAGLACSAGGYLGAAKNYNRLPLTDCPVINDPLGSRPPPNFVGLAEFKDVVIENKTRSIGPGIYKGGLKISGNSRVTMTAGIYVMQDGSFEVNAKSVVRGVGVGVYFTGAGSYFHFKNDSQVDLEAPSTGEMAGLLFFQDREAGEVIEEDDEENTVQKFRIDSDFIRKLVGTIYLPHGHLIINASNDVADESAYTAIVVRKLHLDSAPNLVLNTDYDETTVPVPDGLGPGKGELRLVR
jgi:Flp pilus assembly protein TadG